MTAPTPSPDAPVHRVAVGPWSDLALHTIGWRAFQDLCSQVCEVVLRCPVEIFREAQDGGQDAVFLIPAKTMATAPIGTVQCKHSSDPGKPLRAGDLTPELAHVRELVAGGQADTYIFMTNMSVDAPIAREMRAVLMKEGVRKPHILGRQFLCRAIRSSARLRAMVPQVYGLGDLTAIIDERLSEQSRVLLDSWVPKLKTYVPTRAHRAAARAIADHGVVLLLGNPSSGKSAIGAILSTIASEVPDNTVLALTSPRDFERGWNPNDPRRFFWIDDAFGANVLRSDYVQDWASTFVKLRAAVNHGNRFLLTSRKHIYEAAKRGLGQRNLAEFADGRAVVDVGDLSSNERAQILYNHINYGGQTQSWKSSVKDHLPAVAAVETFLPGIAERLGDPNFTKSLIPREASLVRFMKEPREHLIDTINALDPNFRAALILVYVQQGIFDTAAYDRAAAQAVAELVSIGLADILDCFADLKGSFLRLSGTRWSFAHPTIADALTEILRAKQHMMAALIRGATVETILATFTCEGTSVIQDALIVPQYLDETLIDRLAATPDEFHPNYMLFDFLVDRASDAVFEGLIRRCPDILERRAWRSQLITYDPKIGVYARAHRLGLLPKVLRLWAADELEGAVGHQIDLSFFDNDEMLALIPPSRLIALGARLRGELLPKLGDHIDGIVADADLDDEPVSHFKNVNGALNLIEELPLDAEGEALISDARDNVRTSILILKERKDEHDRKNEDEDDGVDWTSIATENASHLTSSAAPPDARSLFEDVDE